MAKELKEMQIIALNFQLSAGLLGSHNIGDDVQCNQAFGIQKQKQLPIHKVSLDQTHIFSFIDI